MRTHITGVLAHTDVPCGKKAYTFIDALEWPHDSNLTINILDAVLSSWHDQLPSILYLQMDNCWRENKNKYLLGYCAQLVEMKIFKKVFKIL